MTLHTDILYWPSWIHGNKPCVLSL